MTERAGGRTTAVQSALRIADRRASGGDETSGDGYRVPESLRQRAYEEVRRMLICLEIPPSAPIDEERLSAALGIGRTPLREALKRLEIEGLVAVYPRRGTFATDINIESLSTLTELRCALEGLTAELAARRRTASDQVELARLRSTLDDMGARQSDEKDYFELFKHIHEEFYRIANNPYLTATATAHYQLSYRMWHVFNGRIRPLDTHSDLYRELLTSVIDGDEQRARRLAESHVTGFRDEVKDIL